MSDNNELIRYINHLEKTLIHHTPITEEDVRHIRAIYIPGDINVVEEGIENER